MQVASRSSWAAWKVVKPTSYAAATGKGELGRRRQGRPVAFRPPGLDNAIGDRFRVWRHTAPSTEFGENSSAKSPRVVVRLRHHQRDILPGTEVGYMQ